MFQRRWTHKDEMVNQMLLTNAYLSDILDLLGVMSAEANAFYSHVLSDIEKRGE